jgi:hypothetical protein
LRVNPFRGALYGKNTGPLFCTWTNGKLCFLSQ